MNRRVVKNYILTRWYILPFLCVRVSVLHQNEVDDNMHLFYLARLLLICNKNTMKLEMQYVVVKPLDIFMGV